MTFTDDDLKRLKGFVSRSPDGSFKTDWTALLARLEAAERMDQCCEDSEACEINNAWRKAAGK